MSPNTVLATLMPETGTADRLVISVLIPCDRPTHGFQSRKSYFRHVIEWFTFVQLLCSLLTDFRHCWLSAFCPCPFSTCSLKGKHRRVDWKRFQQSESERPAYNPLFHSRPVSSLDIRRLEIKGDYSLSSHLKLWWINFKELSSCLTGFCLYLKVPWFIAGHTASR